MSNNTFKNVPVHLYTAEYQITGFVKVPVSKGFFRKKFISKRLSDILYAASERMLQKGEKDFIVITGAEIMDVKTGRVLRSAVPYLAVNKNSIQMILPLQIDKDKE